MFLINKLEGKQVVPREHSERNSPVTEEGLRITAIKPPKKNCHDRVEGEFRKKINVTKKTQKTKQNKKTSYLEEILLLEKKLNIP